MASRREAGAEPASRRKGGHKPGGIKVTKTIRKPREPVKVRDGVHTCSYTLQTKNRKAVPQHVPLPRSSRAVSYFFSSAMMQRIST